MHKLTEEELLAFTSVSDVFVLSVSFFFSCKLFASGMFFPQIAHVEILSPKEFE